MHNFNSKTSQRGRRKKVIAQLSGGLGNQMFQYAFARSLTIKNDFELVIDNWSGFARDVKYRRNYELYSFPLHARITKPSERLPSFINRLERRFLNGETNLLTKRFYGDFIHETRLCWLPSLHEEPLNNSTWITGYWQSPLYFEKDADLIRSELAPRSSQKEKFLQIEKKIKQSDSVAIGIRLYEESSNPGAHSSDGTLKSVTQIREAVARMQKLRPSAQFFVFCTHYSPLLNEVGFPANTLFLTHDDGYDGTLDRLWLISQCRHHLFTNSTFYWWGAWLSARNHWKGDQIIMAADNFVNRDSICSNWFTF